MSKIFLIGDSHIALGYPNNADKWYNVHIQYFDKFLIPLLESKVEKGDIIIHLGDLFDNRNVIPINLLNYGMSIVERISKIAPLHILIGNHDCYHKSSSDITTVKPFKYIPNVFIYDKTTQVEFNGVKLCMMPFIENKDEQISLIKENLDCEYLFCHSDLNGARMHLTSAAHRNKNKIDVEEFSNFRKVYSGHIHIVDRHSNFLFVGNNFEMDRNDFGNQKGIFILDTDTDKEEFVPNNISPRYKKIYVNKEEDINLIEVDSKDWIDLFISNNLLINNRKLRRRLESILKEHQFETIDYIDDLKTEEDISNENTEEILLEDSGNIISLNIDFEEHIREYIKSQGWDSSVKKGISEEFESIINIYKDMN